MSGIATAAKIHLCLQCAGSPVLPHSLPKPRTIFAGWWIAAGGVDAGESFEEGALRESAEEAGLVPSLAGVLRVEHRVESKGEGARHS